MAEIQQEGLISEKSKDILISRIQDLEFVDRRHKLQYYSCCQCKNVAIRHRIANCDDVYCHNCYRQYYHQQCPVCDAVIRYHTPDEEFERSVMTLKVSCGFKKYGCQAIIELWEFLVHIQVCKFAKEQDLPRAFQVTPEAKELEKQNLQNEIRHLKDVIVVGIKKHEEERIEMKKTIDGLVDEIILVRQEFQRQCLRLHRIEIQNKIQFMDLKATANKHEENIAEIKKAVDGLCVVLPVVRQEVQREHETQATTSEYLSRMTKQIIFRLDHLDTQNQNVQVKISEILGFSKQNAIQETRSIDLEGIKQQEEEIKNIHQDIQKALETSLTTKEHLTTLTNEIPSRMDRTDIQTKKQFAELKSSTKKHEKEMAGLKKVIDDLAEEIHLVSFNANEIRKATEDVMKEKKIQNYQELAQSTSSLFQVQQTMTSTETLQRNRDEQENTFNWTIKGIEEKLSNCNKDGDILAESEKYSIPTNGMEFRAELERIGDFVNISLRFYSKSEDESPPFLHSRKYILVDQTNDIIKKDFVIIDEPRLGDNSTESMTSPCFEFSLFFLIEILQNSNKYVINDEILITIIFEPIAMLFKRVASMNGTLLMRIDNYSKRKQEAIDGIKRILISESFYTCDYGFRVNMEIYLKGYGGNYGKGISIYPIFRIGEWDDLHSDPIIQFNYKRLLMEQSDARIKKNLCLEENNCQYQINCEFPHCEDFVSYKQAENFPYLKDDSLLLTFIIET